MWVCIWGEGEHADWCSSAALKVSSRELWESSTVESQNHQTVFFTTTVAETVSANQTLWILSSDLTGQSSVLDMFRTWQSYRPLSLLTTPVNPCVSLCFKPASVCEKDGAGMVRAFYFTFTATIGIKKMVRVGAWWDLMLTEQQQTSFAVVIGLLTYYMHLHTLWFWLLLQLLWLTPHLYSFHYKKIQCGSNGCSISVSLMQIFWLHHPGQVEPDRLQRTVSPAVLNLLVSMFTVLIHQTDWCIL